MKVKIFPLWLAFFVRAESCCFRQAFLRGVSAVLESDNDNHNDNYSHKLQEQQEKPLSTARGEDEATHDFRSGSNYDSHDHSNDSGIDEDSVDSSSNDSTDGTTNNSNSGTNKTRNNSRETTKENSCSSNNGSYSAEDIVNNGRDDHAVNSGKNDLFSGSIDHKKSLNGENNTKKTMDTTMDDGVIETMNSAMGDVITGATSRRKLLSAAAEADSIDDVTGDVTSTRLLHFASTGNDIMDGVLGNASPMRRLHFSSGLAERRHLDADIRGGRGGGVLRGSPRKFIKAGTQGKPLHDQVRHMHGLSSCFTLPSYVHHPSMLFSPVLSSLLWILFFVSKASSTNTRAHV